MVADAVFRLRMFGLYQYNNNEEIQLSLKDMMENIIKEVHSIVSTPKIPAYKKIDKLNLYLLRKEQLWDKFCKKLKGIKTKPDPSFILDENSILRKVVKFEYTAEPCHCSTWKINKCYYFRVSQWKRSSENQPNCQHDEILLVDRNEERHPSAYKHL